MNKETKKQIKLHLHSMLEEFDFYDMHEEREIYVHEESDYQMSIKLEDDGVRTTLYDSNDWYHPFHITPFNIFNNLGYSDSEIAARLIHDSAITYLKNEANDFFIKHAGYITNALDDESYKVEIKEGPNQFDQYLSISKNNKFVMNARYEDITDTENPENEFQQWLEKHES